MKTIEEIQEAHDILNGLITKESDGELFLKPLTKLGMNAAHDALCWVLEHHNNPTFGDNLEQLRRLAENAGFRLEELKSHSE